MFDKKKVAGVAVAKALMLRKRLQVSMEHSVSPIEAAEALGIEVRFVDLPSMEGIYAPGDEPKIILSCRRPGGRRHFTCAHELGHHAFGHGQKFDELREQRDTKRTDDPEEFAADCFASYFLMPKSTVDSGMLRRGFRYSSLNAIQAYEMSSWLGVGYRTFVKHLEFGLRSISGASAKALVKSNPGSIRDRLLGKNASGRLHIASGAWIGRAIDCEVGDLMLVPAGTIDEGPVLKALSYIDGFALYQVIAPGLGRLAGDAGWAAYVRASRFEYVGRACHRFEEECGEDSDND